MKQILKKKKVTMRNIIIENDLYDQLSFNTNSSSEELYRNSTEEYNQWVQSGGYPTKSNVESFFGRTNLNEILRETEDPESAFGYIQTYQLMRGGPMADISNGMQIGYDESGIFYQEISHSTSDLAGAHPEGYSYTEKLQEGSLDGFLKNLDYAISDYSYALNNCDISVLKEQYKTKIQSLNDLKSRINNVKDEIRSNFAENAKVMDFESAMNSAIKACGEFENISEIENIMIGVNQDVLYRYTITQKQAEKILHNIKNKIKEHKNNENKIIEPLTYSIPETPEEKKAKEKEDKAKIAEQKRIFDEINKRESSEAENILDDLD